MMMSLRGCIWDGPACDASLRRSLTMRESRPARPQCPALQLAATEVASMDAFCVYHLACEVCMSRLMQALDYACCMCVRHRHVGCRVYKPGKNAITS